MSDVSIYCVNCEALQKRVEFLEKALGELWEHGFIQGTGWDGDDEGFVAIGINKGQEHYTHLPSVAAYLREREER